MGTGECCEGPSLDKITSATGSIHTPSRDRAPAALRPGSRASVCAICSGSQSGCCDHTSAANPAACGAAADVPAKGRARHRLGNGTIATRSGLGTREFGPHELYAMRSPRASTAPTASTCAPSPGKGMLPRLVVCSSDPPRATRWNASASAVRDSTQAHFHLIYGPRARAQPVPHRTGHGPGRIDL